MIAGIMLGIFAWLLIGRLILGWLRFSTHIPIPGREQDVRAVLNRSIGLDVRDAVRAAKCR